MDIEQYLAAEPPHIGILQFLFKDFPPKTILDIGACEGEDSIRYASLFPACHFFLFEPLPSNAEIIERKIEDKILLRAELIAAAVGDRNGHADFFCSSGRPTTASPGDKWNYGNKSSSLLAPSSLMKSLHSWLHFEKSARVPVITLDSFFSERKLTSVDFVHMDVQGAEMHVLRGAKDCLRNISAIWLEVGTHLIYEGQPTVEETRCFLESHGFIKLLETSAGGSGDHFYVNPSRLLVTSR